MELTEGIDFSQYWCILKRRWIPAVATFGTVVGLTYFYASSKPHVYSAQGQLLFREDNSSLLIGLDSKEQVAPQSDKSQATEAQLINSPLILQKALELINQNKTWGAPLSLGELQQGLEIANIEGTDILQISYKGGDPKLTALVANQVMNAYVDNNLSASRATTVAAGNFINGQLPMVKRNVQRAEAALRSFKEKNKITDLGQTQQAIAGNIERIGTQIDALKTQLANLDSQTAVLKARLGMNHQQSIATTSLSQAPAVQGVLADFQDVERKLADARSRYQEGHPVISQLKDKEVQLKKLLGSQVTQALPIQRTNDKSKLQAGQFQQELMVTLIKSEVERAGLETQVETLANQQAFYQQKAANLPRLEQQQREALRELSVAQATYETLLRNLQEIRVIENRTGGNVRIIATAEVPMAPVNSSKTSAILAGTLAGILLSAGVIYLIELIDKKIKTVKEARELFEYTVLAAIPIFSKPKRSTDSAVQASEAVSNNLPVIEKPRSPVCESYRMLQANLSFLDFDQALKVIVVTSSVPKEGKSTTCANLAAVVAQMGYRVLIIDADMRRPSQHQIWQISNEVGLMNVLAEQGNFSAAVVQRVINNLYVLPTGTLASNQPVFLDSRSMAVLVEQFRDQYDYVIFDTPPLAIAADALILGKVADGLLLVTRPGLADSISSRLTKASLEQSGQNILGIVVNGVLPENEPRSYYHYAER